MIKLKVKKSKIVFFIYIQALIEFCFRIVTKDLCTYSMSTTFCPNFVTFQRIIVILLCIKCWNTLYICSYKEKEIVRERERERGIL